MLEPNESQEAVYSQCAASLVCSPRNLYACIDTHARAHTHAHTHTHAHAHTRTHTHTHTHVHQPAYHSTFLLPQVDRVLKGYNSTVLAYGQTGSGKTHTMGSAAEVAASGASEVSAASDISAGEGQGEPPVTTPAGNVQSAGDESSAPFSAPAPSIELGEASGLIARAVHALFGRFDGGQGGDDEELKGASCVAKASFIEIYKEEVHDLLQGPNAEGALPNLTIREDVSSGGCGVTLPGLSQRPIASLAEAAAVLAEGAASRATGATKMNSTSSRSHAIFTLALEISLASGRRFTPKLNFVDLAGSERAKRTGASGERFAEGIQINKGLLALGNVISALCERKDHVPYRDSKLTRLLQDSLGGNSHTVMVACVSPSDGDLEETLSTLKYANRARQIRNKLLVAQDPTSSLIADLKEQVAALRARLEHYERGGGALPPISGGGSGGAQLGTAVGAAASATSATERWQRAAALATGKSHTRISTTFQPHVTQPIVFFSAACHTADCVSSPHHRTLLVSFQARAPPTWPSSDAKSSTRS